MANQKYFVGKVVYTILRTYYTMFTVIHTKNNLAKSNAPGSIEVEVAEVT